MRCNVIVLSFHGILASSVCAIFADSANNNDMTIVRSTNPSIVFLKMALTFLVFSHSRLLTVSVI